MWFLFIVLTVVLFFAILLAMYIGNKVLNSIKKENMKFEKEMKSEVKKDE